MATRREYMASRPRKESVDVLIVGAGHNGLVAAILLAREGYQVRVVEEKDAIGGCCRTEHPFRTAPSLGASTGAYLLGLMPPELMKKLDIEIPTIRRDPHWFIPTTGDKYLLFGSDRESMKRQFLEHFSLEDWNANCKLEEELEMFRQDVGATWLMEPLSIEETAAKYVRPALREVFIDLCRKPISHYLARFNFKSDLLQAMFAATDAFSGLNAGWDTPGTGMNFLIHNMCRIPGADGTWLIVRGGMGEVTKRLAEAAIKAGAKIETGRGVRELIVSDGRIRGATFIDDSEIRAQIVVVNADPFRMRDMVGRHHLPRDYNRRLDNYKRDGSTLKVNICFKSLPKFKCLPADKGQWGPTIHILPQSDPIGQLKKAYAEMKEGKLPEFPSIEWYVHSTMDPSIQDKSNNYNSALFVQWVPYELKGTTWEKEEKKYVEHLIGILEQFCPGISSCIAEAVPLTPPKLEKHFGLTRGHIHHVDNSFGFADRLPYQTPIKGLYSCSAGTHPAGSVIGCAGHNAAMRVVGDYGSKKSKV